MRRSSHAKIVDEIWHQHILDTHAYHRDCDAIFGSYLHHFPYFGMRGDADAQALRGFGSNGASPRYRRFRQGAAASSTSHALSESAPVRE
jgi:hypothetical protein